MNVETATTEELGAMILLLTSTRDGILARYRRRIPWRARRDLERTLADLRTAKLEHSRRMALEEQARADLDDLEALVGPPPAPPAPRWDRLRPAVDLVAGMMVDDPGAVAKADLVRAYLVDVWKAQGLDPRHPETLYVLLTGAATVTELATNGVRSGNIDAGTEVAVARIAQTMTAALLPFLEEVLP